MANQPKNVRPWTILSPLRGTVLEWLGRKMSFEIAVGQNGRVWAKAASAREVVMVRLAILHSRALSDAATEKMVDKMLETFA